MGKLSVNASTDTGSFLAMAMAMAVAAAMAMRHSQKMQQSFVFLIWSPLVRRHLF